MEKLISEALSIVGTVDPDAYATGTQLTDAIDMSVNRRVMFIVTVGDLGTAATIDFYVMECATSGGTYTRLTGKNITQLTKTGTDGDKQAIVNVSSEELTSGMRYLKGSMRVGTAASDAAVIALGDPIYSDAVTSTAYGDLASVDEIVA